MITEEAKKKFIEVVEAMEHMDFLMTRLEQRYRIDFNDEVNQKKRKEDLKKIRSTIEELFKDDAK